jgi:hypothetical protein
MSRAVDCFAVCGLSASPVTVSGVARGFVGAEERYLPEVLSSYPSTSSAGNNEDVGSVLAQLALMSMPEGVDVHIRDPPKEALAPRMYPLVLTEPDGALVHVMCLSFLEPVSDAARAAHPALRSACARKCLCLVSRARTPMSVLRAILRAVHRTCFVRARRDAPPLADVVAALVDGVPFPERGAPPALVTVFGRPMVVPAADDDDDASDDEFRLTTSEDGEVDAVREGFRPRTESSTTPLLPDKSSFANGEDQTENRNDARATVPPPTKAWDASATDSGFELLVRALDERNAVRAACAVAEERRVVLRSKNDALLVSASMALTRTLRPLRWRHAFFPLLPIALVSATLEKPGPFIVGIKADFVVPTAVLENAVVVDLDANDVRVFENAARGQQGSLSRDGGFPRAFAEPLLADLRRLASREPPNAADVETSLDENENENERTLPEWARIAAHAAAARAAARGQRWSAHHDDAVGESFRAFWRRCFRGYRAFLRATPFLPSGGKSPESPKSVRSDAGVFDHAGFYRAQVASKDRGTREAAAFVRLVAASAAFEAHAGSQIRAAKRREEKEKRKNRALFSSGVADDAPDRGGEAETRPSWGTTAAGVDASFERGRADDGALFDALLDEDSDERLAVGPAGAGNERKVRGGGFFGTSVAAAAEPGYLRAGAIVHAGSRRLLSARADAGHATRVVSVTFRTVQSSGELDAASSRGASFAAGDGFTSAGSAAGPAAHALALSGEAGGFAPRAPAYPRARVPPIDPPTANTDPAGTQDPIGGSRAPADARGVAGSPATLEGLGSALDARNLDLLERRKSQVRHEFSAGGEETRSPERRRLDSERGRSASPRRSPPFRRNSVDALARVFSNPASATGSPVGGGGDGRFGDDSEDERYVPLEPSDAAGLSPEKSRARRSGSGKSLGLSFSIFGTRRSRRKSEANPLRKVEQAKQEAQSRGGSAHAGQAYARDVRRSAQSVGSAEELAALRRGHGRAASVSAFDGWLAAAADGDAGVKKEKTYASDRSDPGSSAGESEDERTAPRARREPVRSGSPLASPRRLDGSAPPPPPPPPRAGYAAAVRASGASPVTPGAAYSEQTDADAARVLASRLRELWALASADASMSARAAVAAAAIRAVPSPFAPEGAAFAAAAAAELAATDLAGVALALEGGGAADGERRGRGPSPLLKAGVALMSLEEEQGESPSFLAAAAERIANPEKAAPPTAAERKMKAAEAAGRAALAAADEAAARASRAEEAAAIAATPGALAVVHAAAAAAAAAGDASTLLRALAVARVASSSSSFSEHLADADPSAEESFDPAVAVANGDVGRVLCRLPGGAALWGDVRTWRGIESARVAAAGRGGVRLLGGVVVPPARAPEPPPPRAGGGDGVHRPSPARRRRAARAARPAARLGRGARAGRAAPRRRRRGQSRDRRPSRGFRFPIAGNAPNTFSTVVIARGAVHRARVERARDVARAPRRARRDAQRLGARRRGGARLLRRKRRARVCFPLLFLPGFRFAQTPGPPTGPRTTPRAGWDDANRSRSRSTTTTTTTTTELLTRTTRL